MVLRRCKAGKCFRTYWHVVKQTVVGCTHCEIPNGDGEEIPLLEEAYRNTRMLFEEDLEDEEGEEKEYEAHEEPDDLCRVPRTHNPAILVLQALDNVNGRAKLMS